MSFFFKSWLLVILELQNSLLKIWWRIMLFYGKLMKLLETFDQNFLPIFDLLCWEQVFVIISISFSYSSFCRLPEMLADGNDSTKIQKSRRRSSQIQCDQKIGWFKSLLRHLVWILKRYRKFHRSWKHVPFKMVKWCSITHSHHDYASNLLK